MNSSNRPAIPAELKRQVLVESGHRCAIHTCQHAATEIHHIEPWSKTKTHDFSNLIALCPNCHDRADRGDIDKKSLRLYKTRLASLLQRDSGRLGSLDLEGFREIELISAKSELFGYECRSLPCENVDAKLFEANIEYPHIHIPDQTMGFEINSILQGL